MVEVSIILVNFNSAQHTLNCIASIIEHSRDLKYELIVVDNNSYDKSYERIMEKYPDVIWIQNITNQGFGRANNLGLEKAAGRYILLLNTDTIIFDNAIAKCLEKYKIDDEDTAIITCQLLNADKTLQKSIFVYNASLSEILLYNLLYDYFRPKKKAKGPKEIKAIHGAFLFFEKARLSNVGFFDPDFFLYAEEFEWCHRIRKNGLKLKFYDEIKIFHLEEGSSINKEWNIKQRYISTALLFKKTRGNLGLCFYLLLNVINSITNGLLMFKLDSAYRKNFNKSQKLFWSLIKVYAVILLNRYERPLKL